jgi:DNA-binding NtrC family response regulator
MRDVLLIDDDSDVLQSLARALSPLVHPLTQCASSTVDGAERIFVEEKPKVVVLDLCLDDKVGVESGFTLLRKLRALNDTARIIVLTGHGSVQNGIKALDLGAATFLEKPCDVPHLAALIKDGVRQSSLLIERKNILAQQRVNVGGLVGSSHKMKKVHDDLQFAASTSQPVLILGETGTGKSLCARLVHEASKRGSERFVSYTPNFGGSDLVQSELFGHVKGAFTGALTDRAGLIKEAHKGTLFLDEIDELPSETQVRLLDVVQEQRVRPVGSDTFTSVDCRIIAATNRPIVDLLSSEKLRLDLYHRIAHSTITLPPLRERLTDIPELAASVLARFVVEEGATLVGITDEALAKLMNHTWPGNIRELNAVVEAACFRARYDRREFISPEDIRLVMHPGSNSHTLPVSENSPVPENAGSLFEQVEDFKKSVIIRALDKADGNQVVAARLLGIDRGTIRRALRK